MIGPLAQSSWLRVYPDGMYKSLLYATRRYWWPEIWLTGGAIRGRRRGRSSLLGRALLRFLGARSPPRPPGRA